MTRSFAANVGKFNAKAQRGKGADKPNRYGAGERKHVGTRSKWIGWVRKIIWTAAANGARRRFWIGPVPDAPVKWLYRAIYRLNDAQIGQ
jgi:hypothetical protein